MSRCEQESAAEVGSMVSIVGTEGPALQVRDLSRGVLGVLAVMKLAKSYPELEMAEPTGNLGKLP